MEYEMGEVTNYYAWCGFPGCAFATEDTSSKTVARGDMEEHWDDEHANPELELADMEDEDG